MVSLEYSKKSKNSQTKNIQKNVFVTGGRGFVGKRFVEILSELDEVQSIVSFDVQPVQSNENSSNSKKKVQEIQGDLCNYEDVEKYTKGCDVVYHIAGLVGPYFKEELYHKVNVGGTQNVINACKKNGINKLVFCSSPSTRFKGPIGEDICNLKEEDLSFPEQYTHLYSKTKAEAEQLVVKACSSSLMTCAVAPHQVYGPGDKLFVPSLLDAAQKGNLRVVGDGKNKLSVCYVDNLCYALLLANLKLYEGSKILGQFYIVTDDNHINFWDWNDEIVTGCGLPSIKQKTRVPYAVAFNIARLLQFIGVQTKLNPFAVRMITMNRYFNIEKIKNDLEYTPVVDKKQAYENTVTHFKKELQQKRKEQIQSGDLTPQIFFSILEVLLYSSILIFAILYKYPVLQLTFGTLLAQHVLDIFIVLWDKVSRGHLDRITTIQKHKEVLEPTSLCYIYFNRTVTVLYLYHLYQYAETNPKMKQVVGELTILNTVVAFFAYFLLYDFFYVQFHKLLHHPSIYRYIHKHHHQQYVPSRGNTDAVNTHPIEYVIGMYNHLFVIMLFPFGHKFTVVAFKLAAGLWASVNHSRMDFRIFNFFQVKDHDIHHSDVTCNYGQYVMFWDYLQGTFQTETRDKLKTK